MSIRHRTISTDIVPPDANVINERAFDERGVFDPSKDPFAGSYIEAICGPEATVKEIHSIIGTISADVTYHGKQPAPNELPVQDMLANMRVIHNPGENIEMTYRNRIRSPLTGIRAFCVDCKGGSPKAVRRCTIMTCNLWPFRMGKNGLR